ncbi:MAG TPA: ATP-binding protein [Acidimicrobiales bacterium]|nr:ATP-binding protein [Acidimicrobiales bacterium]
MTAADAVTAGDSFNPLDARRLDDEELVRQLQQSTVSNIRDSYHGRFDSFAEAIQNAVDAVHKRWAEWGGPGTPVPGGADEERPQIRVVIECGTQHVQIIDNGIGMEDEVLRDALVPNVTLKRGDPDQRGHKGVGTTYLTYGHDLFEVETKTASGTRGYRLIEGLTWVKSDPPGPPPEFEAIEATAALDDLGSGTSVRMRFGEGTNYGSLSNVFYNSTKLWKLVLQTYTAIGQVSLRPAGSAPTPWEAAMSVSIELSGAAGAGVDTVPFEFHYPHIGFDAADVAELQLLQNNPGGTAKYKLIYLSRDHAGLMQLLHPELTKLAIEDEELHQHVVEGLQRGEIAAYASLGYKNTLYEELWKRNIGNETAGRITAMNVKGGVLVASVGMPIGETLSHLQLSLVLKPEERRRFFVLLHFNGSYRPDIGRKTIPRDQELIIGWLEAAIIRVLRPYANRLQITNEDATHNAASFAQAQQQLQQAQDQLSNHHQAEPAIPLAGLHPARRARSETEVVAQFASILSHEHLSGYEIVALPGNETRYDGLVNVRADTPAEQLAGVPAVTGISGDMFVEGQFVRTRQWLEFKLNLHDLVDEFDLEDGAPNKKYFQQVNLAVCWSAAGAAGHYDLIDCDDTNWKTRNFPGVTHFLRKDGSEHRVEVIALEVLIPKLVEALA